MGDLEIIRATVERVGRRRRWQRGWVGLWRGLLVGGCIWLVGLAIYKVFPLPGSTLVWAGVLALVALPVGFGWGVGRKESPWASARWVDQNQHLQERLSTAWELVEEGRGGEWRDLLLADAARRVREFRVGKAMPYGLPRWAGWIVLILAMGAGIGFVPEYRSERYREERAVVEATREAGQQLAELTARQLAHQPPVLESTREILEAVEELGVRLAKVELNRDQALRELASVSERLREELASLGRRPALKRLEAGNRIGTSSEAYSELRRKAEALQEQLGEQSAGARAGARLEADLEALRQAAANLPSGDSAAADQARAQLAEAMAEMAREAEELGLELPSLEAAIEALEAGRMDQLLPQLQFAAIDLEQLAKMSRALEQLKAEPGEIGKDLAEQLEEAAAELRRLMDQLGDGSALMATLGNLQTAQMCIGNGQGWALCRSQSPGLGRGGRPGGGVGTWADEGLSLDETMNTGLWDNSGVERPEQGARGETDRGAGAAREALVPTQVRGQISPGGAMPAVTLRGLSVRGQSRVEYREAVTAAQVDAQSALSQERVPRAYRGAVREYFDDLKE
jgi:hypothetical protein